MKKTILTLGAVSVALAGSASAAIIASDDFTYADGALAGQNGGTGWASAWANRIGNGVGNTDQGDAVTSGVATVFGDNSAVFDDQGTTYRTLASTVNATGSVWISIDMAFTAGKGTDSFVSLQFRTGAPGATGDPTVSPGWRVGDEWTGSNWAVGNNDTTMIDSGFSTPTVSLDTLLVHINYDLGTSALWVNPTEGQNLGAADAIAGGTPDGTPGSFDTVLLRAGGGGTTYRELSMDNLIIGTEQSDVFNAVPEPSSTALLGLAGLAFILRRRK